MAELDVFAKERGKFFTSQKSENSHLLQKKVENLLWNLPNSPSLKIILKLISEGEELVVKIMEKNKVIEQDKNEIYLLRKTLKEADNKEKSQINHLQGMVEKYKKVIDKVDLNLKQIQQEFTVKLMAVEKKLKREKESKNKISDENKTLKREILEKETQWKRQFASFKNQELKVLGEWDMNSFQSNPEVNFKKSYNH